MSNLKILEELPCYLRPELKHLSKYVLDEKEGAVRMHQNEGFPHDSGMAEICARLTAKAYAEERPLNIYPNLVPERLIRGFSRYLGTVEENVEVTCGSSEGLSLIALACFDQGRTVAITTPSFSLYNSHAILNGASVVPISLNEDMELTREALFNESVMQSSVAILCSPNNPTGTTVKNELLIEFLNEYKGLVIFDEAYFEFAEVEGDTSAIPLVKNHKNLIVLRTLSKAWGAASLRVGCMVGHPELIALFRALRPPYSIPYLSETVGAWLLEEYVPVMRERAAWTVTERNRLQAEFAKLPGIKMFNSKANFLCFKHPKSDNFEQHLKDNFNIMARKYRGGPFDNMMRISLWTETENNRLLSAAREFLS